MIQITWKEYFIFLGGALAVYYLYVALAYYRKEIMSVLRGSGSPGSPQPPPPNEAAPKKRIWQMHEVDTDLPAHPGGPFDELPSERVSQSVNHADRPFLFDDEPIPQEIFDDEAYDDEDDVIPEMEALQNVVALIRDLFATTAPENVDQDALLANIGAKLANYPSLTAQPYKIAINNLISTEAKERYDLSITERDLEAIWPQAG